MDCDDKTIRRGNQQPLLFVTVYGSQFTVIGLCFTLFSMNYATTEEF